MPLFFNNHAYDDVLGHHMIDSPPRTHKKKNDLSSYEHSNPNNTLMIYGKGCTTPLEKRSVSIKKKKKKESPILDIW